MSVSSRRILVVDSNAESGPALQKLISSWGYQVTLERNGSRDLASIAKTDPAVIVDSPNLVSGASFDVLRHVKTHQIEIPVILIAESSSVEVAIRAIQEEGAFYYCEKPVDAAMLRVVLERSV